MNAQILDLTPRRLFREHTEGHRCPACVAPITEGPGVLRCPSCQVVLRCDVVPVPHYRARGLTLPEAQRLANLDDRGRDPFELDPRELDFLITGARPTHDPGAKPGGGAGFVLCCIGFAIAAGLLIAGI